MAEQPSVRVNVDNELGWVVFFIAMLILCWGDPDLLDVVAEFCKRYMEAPHG